MKPNVKTMYGCPIPRKKTDSIVGASEKVSDNFQNTGVYTSNIKIDHVKDISELVKELIQYMDKNKEVWDWLRSTIILSLYRDIIKFKAESLLKDGEVMKLCENKAGDILKIIFGEHK